METHELQTLLLDVMAQWHQRMIRPFKKQLREGMSLGMYYCIQEIRRHDGDMTMSELARSVQCPKQQMTRTVDRLIDLRFVERVSDPADRRIVRLRLTQEGVNYADRFLAEDVGYLLEMLDAMPREDRDDFQKALETMERIFSNMPCESKFKL
jgi:DNA-binding MarR family transcriptional regulator